VSTNVVLVRWTRGWAERAAPAAIGTWGRREGLLGLGAIGFIEEAYRISDRLLETFADVREQITADAVPVDDSDTPYTAYLPGDVVTVPGRDGTPTAERVVAATVAEDDDGYITYAVEFHDVIFEHQVAVDQWLKKMANGTLGGQAKVGSPATYGDAGPFAAPI
jgi:hypothetical protein